MKSDIAITRGPITIQRVISSVLCRSAGGTAIFVGTVRDRSGKMKISRMILESADDLAKRDLSRIAKAAASKYGICRISIRHRIGEVKVGDVIVAIAVSAPHRAEAFAACKFIIDQLKKSTPIWKKEIGGGRERWIGQEM